VAKKAFKNYKPRAEAQALIEVANDIIDEYAAQGFTFTIRQLYYQFVARDIIPNNMKSYKRLSKILNDARMGGMVDWDAIEDRTRSLTSWVRRRSPQHAIQIARNNYGIDMWSNQEVRVEVWVEKEALAGVIHRVCGNNDVPYFSCRGYVSQSEQYVAGQRFRRHQLADGQKHIILHLGDHDPSGLDMTRDNQDRLDTFTNLYGVAEVRRIALNYDQIEEYNPPPNFAKDKDARYESYREEFGEDSWELDALEPSVMVDLIQEHIDEIKDPDLWAEREQKLEEDLETLDRIIEDL